MHWRQQSKSQKINHQMYMDDMKMIVKKNRKPSYRQREYIEMEFGIEKYA